MTSKELLQARAKLLKDAEALNVAAGTAAMDPETDAQFDKLVAEADRLKAQADKVEKVERETLALAEARAVQRERTGQTEGDQERSRARETRLLKAYLSNSLDGLDADDMRAFHAHVRAGLSTSPGNAGGYTIPRDFVATLLEARKLFGGVRQVASTIQTDAGNPIDWPTADATNLKARVVGENQPVGDSQYPTFGTITMGAFKYATGDLVISMELLQDSAFDLESWIRTQLNTAFGRGNADDFTNGNGATVPQGVVVGASVGKQGAAGQTTSITYDDVIDLEHSINPAYRVGKLVWMFNDNTLKILRKMKKPDGTPMYWQNDANITTGSAFDKFDGYDLVLNPDMPDMAAGAKAVLFGNFGSYLIRDVMAVQIVRLNEKYIGNGQVGFTGFQRCDGRYVTVGQQVRAYQNSAT